MNKETISAVKVSNTGKEDDMLHYAVTFFIIALVAAILGFGGIAGSAIEIAKILFFVFLVLSVVVFVFGRGRTV